jgi:hypothetical protein
MRDARDYRPRERSPNRSYGPDLSLPPIPANATYWTRPRPHEPKHTAEFEREPIRLEDLARQHGWDQGEAPDLVRELPKIGILARIGHPARESTPPPKSPDSHRRNSDPRHLSYSPVSE